MAQCSVQDLMNDAACFVCQSPGVWQILELQLLCNIVSAATGGGGGSVLIDATGGAPSDPTKPAISYPTGGGGISTWDVASQTWK